MTPSPKPTAGMTSRLPSTRALPLAGSSGATLRTEDPALPADSHQLRLYKPRPTLRKCGELRRSLIRLRRTHFGLLGALSNVGDSDVHLLDRGRLLLRGKFDLAGRIGDSRHHRDDLREGRRYFAKLPAS